MSYAALLLVAASAATADAQQCTKGKPCGNTCIARTKTCRVGQGAARWAPGADTVTGVAQPVPAKRATCRVTSITDGDTFRCGAQRVRLLLVDAPETNQGAFGAAATRGLASLIRPGDIVALESDVEARDRYGRTLAYVYLADGRMVNEEMARLGLVVVSIYPPNVQYVDRLRAAVDTARAAKRGLWATNGFECLPANRRAQRC